MCKPFQHFIFNMLYKMLYDMFEGFAPGLSNRIVEHLQKCVLFSDFHYCSMLLN